MNKDIKKTIPTLFETLNHFPGNFEKVCNHNGFSPHAKQFTSYFLVKGFKNCLENQARNDLVHW